MAHNNVNWAMKAVNTVRGQHEVGRITAERRDEKIAYLMEQYFGDMGKKDPHKTLHILEAIHDGKMSPKVLENQKLYEHYRAQEQAQMHA